AGDEYPLGNAQAREWGYRTVAATPLLREDKAIGAILLRRTEVRPFDERQLELLSTFAAQAVIAIAHVRLFNETNESLAHQPAAQAGPDSRRAHGSDVQVRVADPGRDSQSHPGCAVASQRSADRGDDPLPCDSGTVQRSPGRARRDIRGSSRDRDRERAPLQR